MLVDITSKNSAILYFDRVEACKKPIYLPALIGQLEMSPLLVDCIFLFIGNENLTMSYMISTFLIRQMILNIRLTPLTNT
jgi:hypothetical protein